MNRYMTHKINIKENILLFQDFIEISSLIKKKKRPKNSSKAVSFIYNDFEFMKCFIMQPLNSYKVSVSRLFVILSIGLYNIHHILMIQCKTTCKIIILFILMSNNVSKSSPDEVPGCANVLMQSNDMIIIVWICTYAQ